MAGRKPLVLVAGVQQELPATDFFNPTNEVVTSVFSSPSPNPTALASTSTLTIAQILAKKLVVTSASAVSLTLPTGTLADAGILGGLLPLNQELEFTIINTGSVAGVVTLVAGVGITIVGLATTPITTSSTWALRKTATNTFIVYRK